LRPIALKINMPIYPKPALDKTRLHQSCFWHNFEKANLSKLSCNSSSIYK
jgi:hypothetical protein